MFLLFYSKILQYFLISLFKYSSEKSINKESSQLWT